MNNPIIIDFIEYIRTLVASHYKLQGMYVGDITIIDNSNLQIPMLLIKTPMRSNLVDVKNDGNLNWIDYEIRIGIFTKIIEDINGNQTLITKEQENNVDNYVDINNMDKLSVEVIQLGDTERFLQQIVSKIMYDKDLRKHNFLVRSVNNNGFVNYSDNFLVGSESTFTIRIPNKYYCESQSEDVFMVN